MQDIVKLFWDLNSAGVDAAGIRIPNAVMLVGDKVTVAAMALFGPDEWTERYAAVARLLVRERPDQLIFGMDRYVRHGQGIDTADLLSVHYWDGDVWKFGVIAYRFDPPFFGEIDWENPWWCGPDGPLAQEMSGMWQNVKAAPHRQPSPAMALPLRTCPLSVASRRAEFRWRLEGGSIAQGETNTHEVQE